MGRQLSRSPTGSQHQNVAARNQRYQNRAEGRNPRFIRRIGILGDTRMEIARTGGWKRDLISSNKRALRGRKNRRDLQGANPAQSRLVIAPCQALQFSIQARMPARRPKDLDSQQMSATIDVGLDAVRDFQSPRGLPRAEADINRVGLRVIRHGKTASFPVLQVDNRHYCTS